MASGTQQSQLECIIEAIFKGISNGFNSIGTAGVTAGDYVSSAVRPMIDQMVDSMELDTTDKRIVIAMFAIMIILGLILSVSLNAGPFSKIFGFILISMFLCVMIIPVIYNIIVRRKLNQTDPNIIKGVDAGYTKQIVIMVLFVLAIVFYMYLDPLTKIVDIVSGYTIFIIFACFALLFLLSYNRYYFNKYSGALVVLAIFVGVAYFWNPFNFLTEHIDVSAITIIAIGAAAVIMMLLYQNNILSDALSTAQTTSKHAYATSLINYFLAIVVFMLCLYGFISLEQAYADNSSMTSWIILIGIIFTGLAISYKFIDQNSFLDKYPIFKVIINIILYLPCIYVNKMERIFGLVSSVNVKNEAKTPKSVWLLLASEILLIGAYFGLPYLRKYYLRKIYIGDSKQGELLINEPQDISSEYLVSSYDQLNVEKNDDSDDEGDSSPDSLNPTYNYAISMWLNVDAMPPSTGSQYTKYTSVFNYGEKPNIKYKADTNSFIITTQTEKNNEESKRLIHKLKTVDHYDDEQVTQYLKEIGIELDEHANLIVYKTNKFLLQKWNNIVLNYSGGTLDVFINGELVQSSIKIVPYIVNDSLYIGSSYGISGGLGSLIYFKHTLNTIEIQNMYERFKHEDPPTFPHNVKPPL